MSLCKFYQSPDDARTVCCERCDSCVRMSKPRDPEKVRIYRACSVEPSPDEVKALANMPKPKPCGCRKQEDYTPQQWALLKARRKRSRRTTPPKT